MMKLQRVTILLMDKEEKSQNIVEAMLSVYPYKGVIEQHSYGTTARWTFLTPKYRLPFLREDIHILNIVGYDVKEVRA